ncbi:MAG: hypothetical protein J3K34DRAFT_525573 [Monoraphidium minutum]|nr:MAG: hypothetical protein J3K34DRAFT_525573 [Monoraphidium minutum]
MSEDHCVICADTLEWTGFGACGHKEACSRCVARLRFVLEDKRCMYCHAPQGEVFFTRYMGDYTQRPDDFEALKDRAKAGDVYRLDEVGGYFDDKEHYKYIKALCSYTHPSLAPPGGAPPSFGSLDALKRRVQDNVKLHFCDLCLKGRKVFISEQVLYSKRDLDHHNRTGDDAGPLAEAGFKGHPPCHFCRSRFYDSGELYNHMERSHEHCFLCRRANPNKYVYFKDYAELDAHFQGAHHPCPHPACLERRFVVFQGEAELKRHFAAEHGEEMRMSRAQRREALAVPVDLQFAPRPEPAGGAGGRRGRGGPGGGAPRGEPGGGDAAAAAGAAAERPGVVIGGGAGLAAARGGMRHSRSDPAMVAAVAASVETAGADAARRAAEQQRQQQQQQQQGERPGSVTFSAADFPAVGGARGGAAATGGTWAAAAVGVAGPSTSGGARGPLGAEDFPELPSQSKAQRQRQKAKAKAAAATLAGRMAAAAAPPRVLNRAAPVAGDGGGAGGGGSGVDGGSGGSGMHASRSVGSLEAAAAAAAVRPATPGDNGGGGGGVAEAFPSLGGGAGSSSQAHPSWVPVRTRAPRPSRADAAAAAAPRASDFPALGGGAAAPRPRSGGAAAAGGQGLQGAVARAAAQGGVSEGLKAANRALVERIKAQLDAPGFASFREQSAAFMRGDLPARCYHDLAVALGLLPLVSQLAELCPDAARRDGLLAAHKAFLSSSAAHDSAALGAGWVPPEAGLAEVARAERQVPWACAACTLVNAPSSRACEVCGAPRGAAAAAAGAAQRQQQQQPAAAPQPRATAAAVLAASLRADAGGGGGSGSRPGSAGGGAAARPAPPPPPPPAASYWPTLAGDGSSSGGGAGPSSSRGVAPPVPDEPQAAADAEDAGGGGGKGKKKKPQKQSLQQLLQAGRTAPGNAWSQPQRAAALGEAPAVAQPKGAWGGKAGGGDKLARTLRATGLGER